MFGVVHSVQAGTIRWPYVDPMLATVYNVGPPLDQHKDNVLCRLGYFPPLVSDQITINPLPADYDCCRV